MSGPTRGFQVTTARPLAATPRRAESLFARHRPRLTSGTVLDVGPAERGDEEERNQAAPLDIDQGQERKKLRAIEDGEGSRVRSELARDLVQRLDQLLPLVGDVSLATYIGLLKRDLSRCHDALGNHPGESNYLSVVTLVESAMSQLKWKQYGEKQLMTIRQALEVGYRQVRVDFGDYEKVCAQFSRQNVDPTPRIDLESLTREDLACEEEA